MKKIYTLFICAVLLTACNTATQTSTPTRVRPSSSPSPLPSATFTATSIPSLIGCVNEGITLRMRSGPGTQFEVINGLASNTCFTVYGFSEDKAWIWIDANGNLGWISVEFSSIEGNTDVLPVIPENISVSVFPTSNTVFATTPKPSPTKTKTIKPSPTLTPRKTSTPFIFPTADTMLCSNAPLYTNVTCKITRAYCSYQPTTSGQPTFCNDFPYPNNQFTLLVWGSDWSYLDGYCLIVSGYMDRYAGKRQIEATSRLQVSFCQ